MPGRPAVSRACRAGGGEGQGDPGVRGGAPLPAAGAAGGRARGGLEAVVRSSQPGQWGPGAWITHVPAVQAVANLLVVRRRLLPAVVSLYDRSWTTLARCVQRPPRPRRSWDGLGFGLVLLHN